MLPRPIAQVSWTAWFVTTAVPPVVLALGAVLAGVGVLVGGLGGLIWLAPAIGFALFGGLVGAWVLLCSVGTRRSPVAALAPPRHQPCRSSHCSRTERLAWLPSDPAPSVS